MLTRVKVTSQNTKSHVLFVRGVLLCAYFCYTGICLAKLSAKFHRGPNFIELLKQKILLKKNPCLAIMSRVPGTNFTPAIVLWLVT